MGKLYNVKRLLCRVVAALVVLLLPAISEAQSYKYIMRDSLGTYKVTFTPKKDVNVVDGKPIKRPLVARTHELRAGIGFSVPTMWGGMSSAEQLPKNYNNGHTLPYYYGDTRWLTLTGDYGYWIKDWFYLGGSLTWTEGYAYRYDRYAYGRLGSRTVNYFSVMPMVRFAWLRRGIVQLYSGAGLGFGAYFMENDRDTVSSRATFNYDLTFIGLSVGRTWFGYIDFGTGSRGAITAGFGYRFQSKSKK